MPSRKKTEIAPVAEATVAIAAETVTEIAAEAPDEKPVKKPAAKKAAPAKKPATKTTKAAAPKETVKIQFGADEYDYAEIKKAVEADYKCKVKDRIKTVEIYIKPEDKAVYYVVNSGFTDKIEL
ncbi:MAG: hypothetical protein IKQ91_06270 [Oscillospiraceae bacterium]|nr:hypothetical protein [Oscillospiraceae bacterium]MBR3448953.1 hypothetical protein [Oscillospiraceae bacterium]MBR4200867.1 hypothetical protein [Oscillospiraceae bacterium]